jgi:prepilin-type N-terminal cleavage/methylation domain-containing protein
VGKTHKRQSGYTITEMIIVIVVLAVLAVILVVAWNGIQTRSKLTAAQADLLMIAKSADLYTVSHDNQRPNSNDAFVSIFKDAQIYDATRNPNGESFAVCSLPTGYVIVAWNPIVTSYKNGDMLYTYSASDGQDIVTLSNSSLSALPMQIDKICDAVYPPTHNDPSAFISWSFDLH